MDHNIRPRQQGDLSHVGTGYHLCPICGTKHDEVVLLDKRLRNSLPRDPFVGWKLCTKHEEMNAEYVALVEVNDTEVPTLETANRTGRVAHVRRSAWSNFFNTPCPDTPLAFMPVDAFSKIVAIPGAEEAP